MVRLIFGLMAAGGALPWSISNPVPFDLAERRFGREGGWRQGGWRTHNSNPSVPPAEEKAIPPAEDTTIPPVEETIIPPAEGSPASSGGGSPDPLPVISTGPLSQKAGLSWPRPTFDHVPLLGGDLSWYWNWEATPSAAAGPGEFVAQAWNADTDMSGVPPGVPIIGFNEPDLCGPQACMDIPTAISIWKQKMGPFKAQGHRLGSPAPAGDSGWLVDFINACRGDAECAAVQPDFITLHLYTTTAGVVADYLTRMNAATGLNVWLTEFAMHSFGGEAQPTTVQQVSDFMAQTTLWLDQASFVERYSWFGAGPAGALGGVNELNRLQNDDGSLTALGQQYVHQRHA